MEFTLIFRNIYIMKKQSKVFKGCDFIEKAPFSHCPQNFVLFLNNKRKEVFGVNLRRKSVVAFLIVLKYIHRWARCGTRILFEAKKACLIEVRNAQKQIHVKQGSQRRSST